LPGYISVIVSNGSYSLLFNYSYNQTIIYISQSFNDLSSIAVVNYRLNRSGAFGAGLFVLIESSSVFNRFAYSVNGVDWLISDPQFEGYYDSMIFGNNRFCCINLASVGPASLISLDGINWSPSGQNFEGDISCIAFGNGLFVGISGGSGSNLIYQSTDGLNWISYPFNSDVNARDIIFGSNNFVFISDNGNPSFYSLPQ